MSKFEIIKTIVESHENHPEKISGMFGKTIVDNCIKELNAVPDLKRVRIMNESLSFLLEQIEICSDEIKTALNKKSEMEETNDLGLPFFHPQQELDEVQKTIDDFNSQRAQYENQIKNLLNEI